MPSHPTENAFYDLKKQISMYLRLGDVRERRGRTDQSTEALRQARTTPAEYPSSFPKIYGNGSMLPRV